MIKKILVIAIVLFLLLSGVLVAIGDEAKEGDGEKVQSDGVQQDSYPFEREYPTVQQLYNWYDTLTAENPNITDKIHLGESWEGRDMWVIKVSDNVEQEEEEPSVFIDGNIHSREWSTSQVASYYLWRIVNDYGSNETITWLVNNREIYVAPMVNPDGYIYDGNGNLGDNGEGMHWRKNRNDSTPRSAIGVDLNRNWDIDWESGVDDPGSPTYHGESPFSENETQNLRDFILSKDIDSYQDLHSYAGTLLIPWGHTTDPSPHDSWYRDMATDMTSMTSFMGNDDQEYSYGQPSEVIGYSAPGGAYDWAYNETGAIGLSYEIYTGGSGFYPPEDDIMDINLDLYDSLVYQARIADTDLGDGNEDLQPPSPYIVYGNINFGEGNPLIDSNVTIENLDTGEKIHTKTDQNGYYEVNFGNYVEEGYKDNDIFSVQTEDYSVNFTIDDSWGKRLDINGPDSYQLTLDIEGTGTIEVNGGEVTEWPFEREYDRSAEVELKAVPDEERMFVKWLGTEKTGEEINITMDEDKEITALLAEEGPEIHDWYDLEKMRDDLGGDYVLMNNLDKDTEGYEHLVNNTEGWDPIGYWDRDVDSEFNGTFDGNGYEIRDLYISRPGAGLVGLFGNVRYGEITDIGVVNANVNGDGGVGALVGENWGTVSNSYVTGDVRGNKSVGGLVGWSNGLVSNSYATSNVSGESEVGGLVGNNRGTVSKSFATGDVNGNENTGGLVGANSGAVSNSFWDNETSGLETSAGGTGKTTLEMKDVATYTDTNTEGLEEPWDFLGDPNDNTGDEDIWDIDQNGKINDGYPFLSSEENETYNLTINIVGEGTVEVDGDEVENGQTFEFEEGTNVTLEGVADEGFEFVAWGGNATGNETAIEITMDEDKEISANFQEKEEEEGGADDSGAIPGFSSTILLLAVIVAVAIYKRNMTERSGG